MANTHSIPFKLSTQTQLRPQQRYSLEELEEREQELIARLYALEKEKAELSNQLIADKGMASSRLEISLLGDILHK